MLLMAEPDQVIGTVVGEIAVEVVALLFVASRTNPRDSDEQMTIRRTFETAHPRVVRMHVGFAVEVLGAKAFHLVQSSS